MMACKMLANCKRAIDIGSVDCVNKVSIPSAKAITTKKEQNIVKLEELEMHKLAI